jgi:alpha-1,3-rhamnosyl/mannosyltransferase
LVLAGSSGWKSNLKIPTELKDRIVILKDVDQKQKEQLYENSFAFLFLSFYEGFGFPVLEAASAGLPVISSFATSLQEIGRDFALMVNPFRPAQVADAMLILENEPGFCDKLKTRGLEAAKKFSWEKTASRTLEVFKNLFPSS